MYLDLFVNIFVMFNHSSLIIIIIIIKILKTASFIK